MRKETIYETCVGNVLLLTGCELNQFYESRREDYVEAEEKVVHELKVLCFLYHGSSAMALRSKKSVNYRGCSNRESTT